MVFDAAKEGDHLAQSIVEKAADYIGKGLAITINMLDPEQIILCGGLTLSGDFFIDMIKKRYPSIRCVMPEEMLNCCW